MMSHNPIDLEPLRLGGFAAGNPFGARQPFPSSVEVMGCFGRAKSRRLSNGDAAALCRFDPTERFDD